MPSSRWKPGTESSLQARLCATSRSALDRPSLLLEGASVLAGHRLEVTPSPAANDQDGATDRLANRPTRRALVGGRVGRVATEDERAHLAGGRSPCESSEDQRHGDEAHRDEGEYVPDRIEAEAEAERKVRDENERAEEPERVQKDGPRAVVGVWEPEPGVQGRKHEEQGVGIDRGDDEGD